MPQASDQQVHVGFDRTFIEKWLQRQRYVWYAIVLLLLVSFTGLLGRGPLAKTTVSSGPGQLEVTYERVLHYKTPANIEVRLPENTSSGGLVRLHIEGAVTYAAAYQEIIPQPVSANPLPNGIVADIPVSAASARGRILILQQASGVGPVHNRIGLEGGPSLSFTQFILP